MRHSLKSKLIGQISISNNIHSLWQMRRKGATSKGKRDLRGSAKYAYVHERASCLFHYIKKIHLAFYIGFLINHIHTYTHTKAHSRTGPFWAGSWALLSWYELAFLCWTYYKSTGLSYRPLEFKKIKLIMIKFIKYILFTTASLKTLQGKPKGRKHYKEKRVQSRKVIKTLQITKEKIKVWSLIQICGGYNGRPTLAQAWPILHWHGVPARLVTLAQAHSNLTSYVGHADRSTNHNFKAQPIPISY